MKSKRFARQFGKACGDFNIVDPADHFLIPVDSDYPHLALLHWMNYKTTKMPQHFKITLVHFHDTPEPNPETVECLKKEASKRKLNIEFKKVEKPADSAQYYKILVEAAIEMGCNKVAIPDSLDFCDATILTNMSKKGMFDGLSIVQPVKINDSTPEVSLTRPFCYLADNEIEKFGQGSEFLNKPTGIVLEEDPYMNTARLALIDMIRDYSNVRMNFFHSQFAIQKKYIGTGEGELHDDEVFNTED